LAYFFYIRATSRLGGDCHLISSKPVCGAPSFIVQVCWALVSGLSLVPCFQLPAQIHPFATSRAELPSETFGSLCGDVPEMAAFKIGINMAGAISAGAYTAGVLDFLTEALDEWYKAKASGEAVPMHDVSIEVLSGASAGGMCAAISAV